MRVITYWHQDLCDQMGILYTLGDWIQRDLKRPIQTLCELTVTTYESPSHYQMSRPIPTGRFAYEYTYTLGFTDGTVIKRDPVSSALPGLPYLISGYEGVVHPNFWLDRYIMGSSRYEHEQPYPAYHQMDQAYRIVKQFAQLEDTDPLLHYFAAGLTTKEQLQEHIQPDDYIPVFRILSLLPDEWAPQLIASMAYDAYEQQRKIRYPSRPGTVLRDGPWSYQAMMNLSTTQKGLLYDES